MMLCIGDLHIGLSWSGLDRSQDVFDFLDKIYHSYADGGNKKELVQTVVWLGDIFDSPNVPHKYVAQFIKYLDKWTFTNHVILKGNHDGEPDSRRGSPLLEVEASGLARVVWEPEVIPNVGLCIPYTTQEKLNKITGSYEYVFTHVDIPGAVPGSEKELSNSGLVLLSENISKSSKLVFAGHIHKPQMLDNIMVVGSVIKCSITECNDSKLLIEFTSSGFNVVPITCREIFSYKINYGNELDRNLYKTIKAGDSKHKDAILAIEVVCPHTMAHELQQLEFEDAVRANCHYLRSTFLITKEKQFRMKELDNTKSNFEIVDTFLTKQSVSNKNELLAEFNSILEDTKNA